MRNNRLSFRQIESYLFDVYNHVKTINDELGKIKRDVFWLRNIVLGILIVLVLKFLVG